AASLLRDLVDLVEGGAAGSGVSGGGAGAGAVMLTVYPAQVEVPQGRALADAATVVHDVHEPAGQGRGRRPARKVEDAAAVREDVGRGEPGVGEGHGPVALHRPALPG